MSGNQEPQISLPTWRRSDFNAAIPIKKRKFFVLPAMEEAGSKPNGKDVGKNALDSSENQKMIGGFRKSSGELISSVPSVSVGIADKAKSIRVKVEEPNFPFHSSSLVGFEIPSNSLRKLPPGVDGSGMKVEHTVLKIHDIVRETCGKENLRGECRTEASVGAGTVSMKLGCKTKSNSLNWDSEAPTELNLSVSKGLCVSHNKKSSSICTESGNCSGVNRSNWDLNTTMDDWEDAIDRKTRVKTTGAFLDSNKSLQDIETSSCRNTTVNAKSGFGKQKEMVEFKSPVVNLMQFDHQVNTTCSLSLGLSSYPPIKKPPSLSAITSQEKAACTSFSRPIMMAGNVNSVNLRTVKSEVIEQNVTQKIASAQVSRIGLSINTVKQEVVGRFSKENSSSSGILKPVDPISIKAETNNFTQSSEILDLPTSSTRNQNDKCISYSNGISNAPISLNRTAIHLGVQSYPDYTLKENSGQNCNTANGKLCEVLKHGEVHMICTSSGHGDHNLNESGVNVTSLTEKKALDDCKACILKELPRNSHGTDELSITDGEKIILSGKELEDDLSKVINNQLEKRNVLEDRTGQGPAAVFADANEVAHAECGGSETDHVEEKGNQPGLLGNKSKKHVNECSASSFTDKFKKYTVDESCLKLVEMASTEVQNKRSSPELQSGKFDGSSKNEGNVVHDGEPSTYQIFHTTEGISGVSTMSGGNSENPEVVDNNVPVSYKAEISTIDNDSPAELSEGSQSRTLNITQVSNESLVKTLDDSDSFVPLRMERDRFPDFPLEMKKYHLRGSDDSCKFSRERYNGKVMRSSRLNFIPDRRRFSDKTESNLHDRDTKNFEFNNHGNRRRGGAFMSNFHRERRPANDEVSSFPHSFQRRTTSFSFTKEDASTFHGFKDGETTEPMFMSPPRPYQGRNGFTRGRTKFSNNPRRDFVGFHSRSPVRSRERSPDPSSSFRNRSQEEFSGNTGFSHRRSPSYYKTGRINSPDHSGYPREMNVRRHISPPYLHRSLNAGRGRGYARGRGFARGRGYGRDGISFRKPSDRFVRRQFSDPREWVDYSGEFFEGPVSSERFGVDVNVERRQFGYRHDGTSSSRSSFNNDACTPEDDPNAVRFRQDLVVKKKNSSENASKDIEEEET